MFLSVFDLFKIGIGPSSSHTMGPMIAGSLFLSRLRAELRDAPTQIQVRLHGSLAFTGKGHATDRAAILGLAGFSPETYDLSDADATLAQIARTKRLRIDPFPPIAFDPETDLVFDFEVPLSAHSNGMGISARDENGDLLLREVYYSIGGGFVLTETEMQEIDPETIDAPSPIPFPFRSAQSMLDMASESGRSIAAMKLENELCFRSAEEIDTGMARIWQTMNACIERGLNSTGQLPGGLSIKRRAMGLRVALQTEKEKGFPAPHSANDWVSCYAMAVNEENAAGGQVVTAPTNGAAGVIPAVIRYWLHHLPGADVKDVGTFLLTAAAIGGLIKTNASISGAECGCQAEVGSAAAMAAAGLAAVLGGTPHQIENAAEIALEHHLGMTCDPVKGLVQVPCIERNALGAIKAISAASLALHGDGTHFVPLDAVVETMRQTGNDMNQRYKETSLGGLAVNVPNC
ncbi:L-serine ammonia-lyase [Celeribacter sp.]|uniref:L-serine ammonia-lyase n=1 Tax=Celeribacter sp. TaxID=1890673 RepID=UPI003A90637B